MVIVFLLWLLRHGPESVTTADRALDSVGLLTGLVSSDLLLLQVMLLARVPWVEQAWGHGVLARRHRWIGFASFWLMLAHVVAFAVVWLVRDNTPSLAPLWALFVTNRWMFWATLGTLLIVVVTVTSMRRARRRLRYETWHLLHLYAYLGIGLALPHQIVVGSDFQSRIAEVYWWSLYAVAAAAVLVFRLGLPLWRSFRYRLRVTGVKVERPGVVSIQISGRRLSRLRTRSGQFFIWRFLDGPGWMRGHPYTISAAPDDGSLRITVQAAGDGSVRAARLRPGTRVLIEGPYGTMTAERRRHQKMVLLAAGVGITPIRALMEDTGYAPGDAALIYRFSMAEHAIFVPEIVEIAARRGVKVVLLPGARRADRSWQAVRPPGQSAAEHDDAEALLALVPDLLDSDIFACGPPEWVAAVRQAVRRAGGDRDQVHTEDFAW